MNGGVIFNHSATLKGSEARLHLSGLCSAHTHVAQAEVHTAERLVGVPEH